MEHNDAKDEQPVGVVYAHPAHIETRASFNRDELTKIAQERALDPDIFEEEGMSPWFWRAIISNNSLDSYFTHMDNTSLRNFAEDATNGVAFMTSHDVRKLPLGQSLTGRFVSGRAARVEADFYTLRGLNTNGISTDDFINGVRAGIIKDVSVGFYGGTFRCDVCSRDLWDWDCWHIPGVKTNVVDKDGNATKEQIVATATVEGARLSEVSGVYDGATPGAAIQKAEREIQNINSRSAENRIRPDAINLLESRYRIKLPNINRTVIGVDIPITRDGELDLEGIKVKADMGEVNTDVVKEVRQEELPEVKEETVEEVQTPDPASMEAVAERADEILEQGKETQEPEVTPENESTNSEDTVEGDNEDMERTNEKLLEALEIAKVQLADGEEPLERAVAELKTLSSLRELADLGRQYKADVVQETLDEGIRAMGNDFAVDTYRDMLESLPNIVTIKRMRDDFRDIADNNFAGGRSTPSEGTGETEEVEQVTEETKVPQLRVLPNRAHRA